MKYDQRDLEQLLNDILDEDQVEIAGMFYDKSDLLKSTDPIAYDTILFDHLDALVEDGVLVQVGDDYYSSDDPQVADQVDQQQMFDYILGDEPVEDLQQFIVTNNLVKR